MQKETKQASVFLFTSYQGGIGKSSLAWQFAKSLIGKRGLAHVAYLEFNLFAPSSLLSGEDLQVEPSKSCLFDCFASDWRAMQGEDLPDLFSTHEGVLTMPFCGNRVTGSLEPRFNFMEKELTPFLKHLLGVLTQAGYGVVMDLTLNMGPLALFLLEQADCIYYLFSTEPPSPHLAKQFEQELQIRPHLKNKVYWLHNLIDPEMGDAQEVFPQEISIPISGEIAGQESTSDLNAVVATMVTQALALPALGGEGDAIADTAFQEIPEALREYQRELRAEIVSGLEKRFELSESELRRRVEKRIENALSRKPPPEVEGQDARTFTKKTLLDDILGLGPLEEFMRDAEVDEIMVNGPDRIFIEKRGRLQLTKRTFSNADHVRTVIDRILMPVGRTVNERTPYVDARLADGSRVHAIIPPLALTGPMLTIRRFSSVPYTIQDLVHRFKTLTQAAADFLQLAVKMKKNIIVSGGASSGKTTLLNVLSTFISPGERVICIEDSAELRLNLENLGRLEARQKGTEAKNQVTIRDLVSNSLRMRPDRIIVGECRGAEALDMLQAMNTGHDGSLTTLHANSTRDALARLETMVLMAGVDLPLRAIREQIASSVNIIVQTNRMADGCRRINEISEVVGIEDTTILTEPLFRFEKKWIGEDGHVFGELKPTGTIPSFIRSIPGAFADKVSRLFVQESSKSPSLEEERP